MAGESRGTVADRDRAAQVREELRRILASEAFKGGKRAQDFLQLVVEHALAGRAESLRERMLGVEMFGRPVDYDTANDAVVRVKATEVRRRLGQYYATFEGSPAVRINLPTGSYVPQFLFEADSPIPEPVPVSPPEARESSPAHTTLLKTRPVRWILVAGGCALVFAVLVLSFVLWRSTNSPEPIRSVAVLPLANYSGDSREDYFADGMTDILIAELGQISSLRVISRTSSMAFKGTQKTIPQIAHELSVDSIVEGSVERAGSRVRITAQLIDARNDQHIWAHTYDRDMSDAMAVQSDVAGAIADRIKAELTPAEAARLSRNQHVDPEATDLYMRGMQELSGVNPKDAINYFQQAIDKDPKFARAHAALAEAYGWAGESGRMPYADAFAQQRAEALKAIELDDSRPEPHLQLAFSALDQNWDWATCRKEMERARAINANSNVHWSYAQYLSRIGHMDDAMEEARLALQLDPVSSHAYVNLAFIHYFARHYDAALDDLQRASYLPHTPKEFDFPLGAVYVEKGMYEQAIQKFTELGGPHALGHIGNIYARQGRRAQAQSIIQQMKDEIQRSGIGRYEIALIYTGLGDKNDAFTWLESAFQVRDKGILYIKMDPCLDPLRSDSRLQSLIARVAFPS